MQADSLVELSDIFCDDLPSTALIDAGIILVSGASGYIGGRLVPELLHRGYKVRAVVMGDPLIYKNIWPEAQIVRSDALNKEEMRSALSGIDSAYYLIHSLHLGPKESRKADIKAAGNFREAAQEQGVKRIIYLGGLGDRKSTRLNSSHSQISYAVFCLKKK